MDAYTAVALSMHRDGIAAAEIADALGMPLADVEQLTDADQSDTIISGPLTIPDPADLAAVESPSAAELLDWAGHHHDPDVRAYGRRAGELLDTLAEQHRHDSVELRDVLGEITDMEKMLDTLRRRAVLLQGLPAETAPAPALTVVVDDAPATVAEPVDIKAVRTWAQAQGLPIKATGRIAQDVVDAWRTATAQIGQAAA